MPKPLRKFDDTRQVFDPTEIDSVAAYSGDVEKRDILKEFLTTVFEVAATAGLSRKEVMQAMLRHQNIIGEPDLPSSFDLPESAPELYVGREDKMEGPLEFLDRVWGAYRHILFREDIERLGDIKLIPAIYSYCQRKGLIAEDHLPPSLRDNVDGIVAALSPQEIEAARLWTQRQGSAARRKRGPPQ